MSSRFHLQRDTDVSGVSGTGTVADGIEFPDGTCVIRWRGYYQSTVVWPSVGDVEAVHGHGGATRIVWDDPYPHSFGRCWRCAAGRGEPCTIIDGGVGDDYEPTDDPAYATGAPRSAPHSGRSQPGDFMEPAEGDQPIGHEPNHYADQPHTAECGGPGVCPLTSTTETRPACARCGEPALGYATIGRDRYCHSDERSCYTLQTREIGTTPTTVV